VGAVLGGVIVASDVFIDYAIMIAFSVSLFVALKMGVINRVMGMALAMAYVSYLVVIFFI